MSGKAQKPPVGEPWVWLTRELLASDAWRSLGINGRRFIDFLLLEHMRHKGRANGDLIATKRQLAAFGISEHCIGGATGECDMLGLVDCKRGRGRRPSVYALTWLPLLDGTPPTNRWRIYRDPALATWDQIMGAVSTYNGCRTAPTKPVEGAEQHPQSPKNPSVVGAEVHPPSRSSYQGGEGYSFGEGQSAGGASGHGDAEPTADVAPDGRLPWRKPMIIDIPIKRVNGEAAMPDDDAHHQPTFRRVRP
jgi:hypothetical protein